jgi:hypothetical protein
MSLESKEDEVQQVEMDEPVANPFNDQQSNNNMSVGGSESEKSSPQQPEIDTEPKKGKSQEKISFKPELFKIV